MPLQGGKGGVVRELWKRHIPAQSNSTKNLNILSLQGFILKDLRPKPPLTILAFSSGQTIV